jgi:hypothetical protein
VSEDRLAIPLDYVAVAQKNSLEAQVQNLVDGEERNGTRSQTGELHNVLFSCLAALHENLIVFPFTCSIRFKHLVFITRR